MKNYNISKYFNEENIKYYEPIIIITIIEDILGKNLDTIKTDLKKLKINVNEKQIQFFLNKTFEEKEPEIKARIENPRPIYESSKQSIEESVQRFEDENKANKYKYDPDTFNYFNNYSNIVRHKAKKILDIIEKIIKNDLSIIKLLKELDIKLVNGKITKEDIIRLITPFIYNYNTFIEKINTANTLETYLYKHFMYTNGRDTSDSKLYPLSSLQIKNIINDYCPDNIPLSTNQKNKIIEEEKYISKLP